MSPTATMTRRGGKAEADSPFSAAVCRRLEHFVGIHDRSVTARAEMFHTRDNAASEAKRCGKSEKAKKEHWEAVFGEAVMEIEDLNKTVKWSLKEVLETVRKGRQAELFDDSEPLPKPPPELFERKAPDAKDASSVGGEDDTPEGVDEHLRASVNELDLREDLKGKLIAAKLGTVGALVQVVDSEMDLGAALEIGQNKVAEIKKALGVYRRKHRSAMAAAER